MADQGPAPSLFAPGIRPIANAPTISGESRGSAFAGDPSISLRAGGGAFNPLDNAVKANEVLQGSNANKMFKATFDARVQQEQEAAKAAALENAKREILLAHEKATGWAGLIEPVAAKGDNATKDDVFNLIGEAARLKLYNPNDPKEVAQMANRITDLVGPGDGGLAARIKTYQTSVTDQVDRTKRLYGIIDNIDTGPSIQPTAINPVQGTTAPLGAPLDKGPTPAERNAPTAMRGPGGEEIVRPRSAMPMQTGMGAPVAGTGSGPAMAIGPTQQESAYNEARGSSVGGYEKDLDDAAQRAVSNQVQLGELSGLLSKGVPTGGGSEFRANVAQGVQALLENTVRYLPLKGTTPEEKQANAEIRDKKIQDTVDSINQHDVGNSQEFAKFAVQNAMGVLAGQLRGAAGSRVSEFNFATYLQNNPSLLLDPRANAQILKYFDKLNGMTLAEQQYLDKRKKEPGFDMAKFPAEWQREADKRFGTVNVTKDLDKIKKSVPETKTETKVWPTPTKKTIAALQDGRGTAEQFDAFYGPGASAKVLGKK